MKLKAINAYRLTTNTEDSDVYIHNDEFCCGGDLVKCYLKEDADKVIAEKDAEISRMIENWNRLCEKYNKFIKLKQEFCDKLKDIELEITK